jgi:transcriptional regulator with XRE-family HTH domain
VVLVPSQIRSLRLKSTNPPMPRQQDLAEQTGLHQSRISMFETPGAANMTLETIANVAAGLKVGVIVKFVPFSEMLQWENNFEQDSFDVVPRLESDQAFLNPTEAAVFQEGQFAEQIKRDDNFAKATSQVDGISATTARKPMATEDELAMAATAGIGG